MTVKELIEKLAACNPDTPVRVVTKQLVVYSELTSGYYEDDEEGVADVLDLETYVHITTESA